jgi:methylmalonyl-CoA mutase
LTDLERGVTSIALKIASGYYPGVSSDQLGIALEGVYLDLAPIQLIPGEEFVDAGKAFLGVLEKTGVDPKAIKGSLGIDPIGTFAASGRLKTTLDEAMSQAFGIAKNTTEGYPELKIFNIDVTPYHLAGATEAQELGVVLASAVAYLRENEKMGGSADAFSKIAEVTLSVDTDIYLNIAKFRAARRLWANLMQACGVVEAKLQLNAVSSLRMMTTRDPWVNILRATSACFAAGTGGADRITVLPHDTMIGLSSDFACRISRNVQVILQEESSLGIVADPAAGSYALETLTDQIAEQAWSYFQKIETSGGIVANIRDGLIAGDISEAWSGRLKNLAKRKDAVTGVSEFPDVFEKPITDCGAIPSVGPDIAPAGDTVTPLPFHRLAEGFEGLRTQSDQILTDTGARPQIFLANLGSAANHTARATFAKNFFEAGGVEAIPGEGYSAASDLQAAFKASGAKYAVICGSDADYDAMAIDCVRALKGAGCEALYLAGRQANVDALTDAGVDEFIYMGANVLETLARLIEKAGDVS